MVGDGVFKKWGDFVFIDNLVKIYPGTYTHDDIFDLNVLFVHNLIIWNKEKDAHQSKANEALRQIHQTRKK